MTENHQAVNPSLIRKSNARMAAAQILYQCASSGAELHPQTLTNQLKQLLSHDTEALKAICASKLEPHYPTLTKLLTGIHEHQDAINALIDSLQPRQERERMSVLLLAILQCGIFELRFSNNLKTPLVINEYTALASRFFDEPEVAFVHAMLQKLNVTPE